MAAIKLNRKFVLIGLSVVAVVTLILVLVRSNSGNRGVSDNETSSNTSARVTLDNISDYVGLINSRNFEENVQGELANKLLQDQPNSQGDIHALVRAGSYSKVTNDEGTPYFRFLVDIAAAKQTYAVTFLGGDDYTQEILYVVCPTESELVFKQQGCKEVE